MKWRWSGIALLPVLAGLVLATLVMTLSTLPNPIIYFRANLDVLVFLAGFLLSVLIAIGLALWIGPERRRKKCVTGLRAKTTKERRRFVQRLDHEPKNPLTAIRAGPANVVNDSMAAEQQDALASVEAQVMRLSHLTADLRKLAELET
jgi:two-component system OmpR family sensor kinase